MDVLDINSLINQLLKKISKEQKHIFLLGDININLLNYNEHQPTSEFLDSLAFNSIIPYILQPASLTSHSKALIDNTFSNVLSCEAISGNTTATISDHLPQLLFAPNVLSNPYAINQTSWREIGQNLTNKVCFKNWSEILQLDQHNVNLSMDSCLDHMNDILNINSP